MPAWFRDHYVAAASEIITFLEEDGISLIGREIADVGCGDGVIDLGVCHRAQPSHLVGFDLELTDSKRLLQWSRRFGVGRELPGALEFRTATAT
jgi:predicted RNA methylase